MKIFKKISCIYHKYKLRKKFIRLKKEMMVDYFFIYLAVQYDNEKKISEIIHNIICYNLRPSKYYLTYMEWYDFNRFMHLNFGCDISLSDTFKEILNAHNKPSYRIIKKIFNGEYEDYLQMNIKSVYSYGKH